MLESALTLLFEGRHVSEEPIPDSLGNDNSIYNRFWRELQMLLKKMLVANKSSLNSQQPQQSPPSNIVKLKEVYKMSLKSTPDFTQLHAMHRLWTS